MANNIAIKVEEVTKLYKLYNSPVDRLKESLHPLRRKYHHDYFALKDINFELKKGEAVGVIGKNGSGKSTLLKILTGIIAPTSGSVIVNGRVSALLELGAGFNPELSGVHNVYFNGMLLGLSRDEIDQKLDDILSFADIGEYAVQPVKTYSSGMFVRLAFAVAINVEPDILVIDEALAVGDLRFQRKCKEKMHEYVDRGVSLLIVSHNMSDIRTMCRYGLYLKNGVQSFWGKSSDAVMHYVREEIKEEVRQQEQKLSNSYEGDKGGTGDIYLYNIICYEKGGSKENKEIMYGENIIIEFEYRVKEIIEEPNFRITISSAIHKHFACINSDEHDLSITDLHGNGKVLFEIKEPNLYPNGYFVNIGVTTKAINSHLFFLNNACNFIILSPKERCMTYPTAITELNASVKQEFV